MSEVQVLRKREGKREREEIKREFHGFMIHLYIFMMINFYVQLVNTVQLKL